MVYLIIYRVSTIQGGAGFLPSTRYVHFNREHDGLWIRRYLMWKFPNAINLPTKRGIVNNPSHWKTCVLGWFFGIGFTISWPTHKGPNRPNQNGHVCGQSTDGEKQKQLQHGSINIQHLQYIYSNHHIIILCLSEPTFDDFHNETCDYQQKTLMVWRTSHFAWNSLHIFTISQQYPAETQQLDHTAAMFHN